MDRPRKIYQTLDQLERELFFYTTDYNIRNEIESGIRNLKAGGAHRKDGFEQKFLEIVNSVPPLSLERFFENSYKKWGDPNFDFDTYADLFFRAHKQFGHFTGDYFSLSFIWITKTILFCMF